MNFHLMQAKGPAASVTYNGHPFDEIKSCIQKYIRRGETEKAIYVAIEADLFSLIPKSSGIIYSNAKSRRTNFMNRLRAIVGEEIGIAVPSLILQFDELYQTWNKYRDYDINMYPVEQNLARQALLTMVKLLSQARKIRLVSDIKSVYFKPKYLPIIQGKPEWHYIFHEVDQIDSQVTDQYPLEPTQAGLRDMVDGIISGIKNKSDRAFYWINQLLADRNPKNNCPRDLSKVTLLFKILFDYANQGPGLWGGKTKDDPMLKQVLTILYRYYNDFKNKTDCYIFLILPVLYAVRSIDWNFNALQINVTLQEVEKYYQKNISKQAIILDLYCLDIHTKRGKQLKKTYLDFAQEGALVTNQEESLLNDNYRKIYVYLKLMDQGLTNPLQIESIMSQVKMRAESPPKKLPPANIPSPLPSKVSKVIIIKKTPPLKKVILTKVITKSPEVITKSPPPSKKITLSADSERERFNQVVRTQLTCATYRPDVYFAVDNVLQKRVVVKGPFDPNKNYFEMALAMNHIKDHLPVMNTVDTKIVYLKPDMWLDVPIGLRNSLHPSQNYPFMIMEDICHTTLPLSQALPTKNKGSKLWPDNTQVYDDSKSINECTFIDLARLRDNPEMRLQMLLAYAFRYVFEITDTCDRNFLIHWVTRKVYSIDEENFGEGARKWFTGNRAVPKKENRKDDMLYIISQDESKLKEVLQQWKSIIDEKREIFHQIIINSRKKSWPSGHKTNIQFVLDNIEILLTRKIGDMI